eukprot:Rmarinus@m.17921
MDSALQAEIRKKKKLRKSVTVDKSGPLVAGGVVDEAGGSAKRERPSPEPAEPAPMSSSLPSGGGVDMGNALFAAIAKRRQSMRMANPEKDDDSDSSVEARKPGAGIGVGKVVGEPDASPVPTASESQSERRKSIQAQAQKLASLGLGGGMGMGAAPPAAQASEPPTQDTGDSLGNGGPTNSRAPTTHTPAAPSQQPAAAPPAAGNGVVFLDNEWMEVTAPDSGKVYYVNRHTRETTWTKPGTKPALITQSSGSQSSLTPSPAMPQEANMNGNAAGGGGGSRHNSMSRQNSNAHGGSGTGLRGSDADGRRKSSRRSTSRRCSWRAIRDESSGQLYYYNRRSKETTWEKPAELIAFEQSVAENDAEGGEDEGTDKKKSRFKLMRGKLEKLDDVMGMMYLSRYFVMEGEFLAWFHEDLEPDNTLRLRHIASMEDVDKRSIKLHANGHHLTPAGITLRAETEEIKQEWAKALKQAIKRIKSSGVDLYTSSASQQYIDLRKSGAEKVPKCLAAGRPWEVLTIPQSFCFRELEFPYSRYVVYVIHFHPVKYIIERRYSDFFDLHRRLWEATLNQTLIPPVPPKTTVTSFSRWHIEDRRNRLEDFMQQVVNKFSPFQADDDLSLAAKIVKKFCDPSLAPGHVFES